MNRHDDLQPPPGAGGAIAGAAPRASPAAMLLRSGATFCALAIVAVLLFNTRAVGEVPVGHWDKLAHVVCYGSVAMLLTIGLGAQRAALAFFITCLAGLADEMLQMGVPTRHADLWDLTADALAAAVAVLLVRRLARRSG